MVKHPMSAWDGDAAEFEKSVLADIAALPTRDPKGCHDACPMRGVPRGSILLAWCVVEHCPHRIERP